jgi:hypothetical protein
VLGFFLILRPEGGGEGSEEKTEMIEGGSSEPAVEYLLVFSPGIGRCRCRGSVGVEEIGELVVEIGEEEVGP